MQNPRFLQQHSAACTVSSAVCRKILRPIDDQDSSRVERTEEPTKIIGSGCEQECFQTFESFPVPASLEIDDSALEADHRRLGSWGMSLASLYGLITNPMGCEVNMRDHASIPHTTALEAFKRARDRQLSWIDGEKLLHQLLQTGVDRSEEVVKWSLQHHFFGDEPRKSYVMQGKAALTSGGHFDLSGCACLHFYCRDMTCNALP